MTTSSTDIAAMRAQRVQLAREDLATFVELVGRDERTNKPVTLAPYQIEMLEFIAANTNAVVHSHIESGKSFLISVLRTLWLLGRDPNTHVIVCSSTHGQATRIVRAVARYIESSAELHEVFPLLARGDTWRDDAIAVARSTISKDASLVACGVRGNILGARAEHIILDDVDDRESTNSEHMRTETIGWIRSTLLSRLTAGGSIVVACTPWHPSDISHTLAEEGWPLFKAAVTDADGRPRWPERWPLDRIERARATMSMFEAARALDVDVRSSDDMQFRREHIQLAIQKGHGRPTLSHLYSSGPTVAYVGVDLAVSKNRRADKSAFAVVLHHEISTPAQTGGADAGDRELVYMRSARLDANEIMLEIARLHMWFKPASIVVENVAAQDFIVQLLRKNTAIPVKGFTTGVGAMSLKHQVQLLSDEFARGKWLLRAGDEIPGLARDMLFYEPGRHTPDRLAALCFARWAVAEGTSYVGTIESLDLLQR